MFTPARLTDRSRPPVRRRPWTASVRTAVAGAGCLLWFATGHGTADEPVEADTPLPVSYRRDVRQLLAKQGCNAGPCHGNANGKGGFKLSLRGEDPASDWVALTHDQGGRRIHLFDPASSLLLLKATAALAHEGGQRFEVGSDAYRTLHRWIAAGALDDPEPPPPVVGLEVTPDEVVIPLPITRPVAITAQAIFADGSRRNVTHEAVYETVPPTLRVSPGGEVTDGPPGEGTVLVRYLDVQVPVRIGLVTRDPALAPRIAIPEHPVDRAIFSRLQSRGLQPTAPCSDERFLRRIALDLLGRLPTTGELSAFLADPRPDRRDRWIDAFLEEPAFADAWALKWADLLRVEERTLDRKGMESFHRWIRQAIAGGMPMDTFTRTIVSARGSTYTHPPANFYRANRTPVERGLAVAQVFLGVRLNCAQCHNHPFDRWSQDDYHDWAATFARVQYRVLRNDRRDSNDSHEFKGEQVVYLAAGGTVGNPRTGKPAVPRLLGESEPLETVDELEALGSWIVRQPAFAEVQVNRIWAHLMGRGLVDPVDDVRATNPATHPDLLADLARHFVASGHDLRSVIRLVCTSQTYQLDSQPHPDNPPDTQLYSWTAPRRLPAETLLDIQHQAADVPLQLDGFPRGWRATQLPGGLSQRRNRKSDPETFLELFGKPPRLLTCDCERSTDTSMAQAFHLINSPLIHGLLQARNNRLKPLAEPGTPPIEAVRTLYQTVLSRLPTLDEEQALGGHLAATDDRRAALEDILWSLFNATEFIHRF